MRWAPAAIVATSLAGVGLGLTAVSHDGAEVKLMGASLVLGSVILALLASIAALGACVAVARWHDSPPPPHVGGAGGPAGTTGGPRGQTDVPSE